MTRGDLLTVSSGHGSFTVTFQNDGKCRACKAPMLWAVTATGKRMPLDATPRADGLYESHFATCKRAGEFRRKG